MRSLSRVGAIAIGALLSTGLMAGDPGTLDSAARLADGGSGQDWAGPGGTFGEQHFSPLVQIDSANIGNQVSVQVRNKSAGTLNFTAGLIGAIAK